MAPKRARAKAKKKAKLSDAESDPSDSTLPAPPAGREEAVEQVIKYLQGLLGDNNMTPRDLYKVFNKNKDKGILEADFETNLAAQGVECSKALCKAVFDRLDADGDGEISLDDFNRGLRKPREALRPESPAMSSPPSSNRLGEPAKPSPRLSHRSSGAVGLTSSQNTWGRLGPPPSLQSQVDGGSPDGCQLSANLSKSRLSMAPETGELVNTSRLVEAIQSSPEVGKVVRGSLPKGGGAKAGAKGESGGYPKQNLDGKGAAKGKSQRDRPGAPSSRRSSFMSSLTTGSEIFSAFSPAYAKEMFELRGYLHRRFKTRRKAFQAMDTNGNGGVSHSEMVFNLDRLHVPWMEMFPGMSSMEVFKVFNKSHSGEMTPDELLGPEENWDQTDSEEEVDDYNRRVHINQCLAEVRTFDNPEAAVQFADWAFENNRWAMFQDLFFLENAASGLSSTKYVDKKEFVNFVRRHMYRGSPETLDSMYAEIQKECKSDKDDLMRKRSGIGTKVITRQQFHYFQLRLQGYMATLSSGEWGSPAGALLNTLRHRFGTSFRGWRKAIDIRSSGRVAYVDFAVALRNLGMTAQVKQIWCTIRPDGSPVPIEFREVDPVEASLIDSFTDLVTSVLGAEVDVALQKAFTYIDKYNQGFINSADFTAGVQELGYKGNAEQIKVIFGALDNEGTKRLKLSDFMYLPKVSASPISVAYPHSSRQVSLKIKALNMTKFMTWVTRNVGNADKLVDALGLLRPDAVLALKQHHHKHPAIKPGYVESMQVKDMARKLEKVGFQGNGPLVALALSGQELGPNSNFLAPITAEQVISKLAGLDLLHRTSIAHKNRKSSSRPGSPRSHVGQIATARPVWSDDVHEISDHNQRLHAGLRSYFSTPERLDDNYIRCFTGDLGRSLERKMCRAQHFRPLRVTHEGNLSTPGTLAPDSPGNFFGRSHPGELQETSHENQVY